MISGLDVAVAKAVEGKIILVTGAAGTIGSAVVKRLLGFKPRVVRLLDHNEEEAFYWGLTAAQDARLRVLLGDIRDRERMKRAIQSVDIIIHAAALKHVGLGEYNPFEVVRTNLVALQSLIECALDANVERFIFTSSDKAVNPTNVMGGSKFIGERLVTAASFYRGQARTIFASTRFGNVLGSAGSVVPVFRRQIAAGGPLTITDKRMTRFFMTLQEAVDLLLGALVASRGGEVFVPKMHAIRLSDLASCMLELLAPGKNIAVEEIGLRPGEKMHEELISEHELPRCVETERLLIVLPMLDASFAEMCAEPAAVPKPSDYPDQPRWAREVFGSQTAKTMERSAVLDLFRTIVLQPGLYPERA